MKSFRRNTLRTLFAAPLAVLVTAAAAFGQGVIIPIDPIPLPRPIIRPRPQPVPQATYKIKELAVNARIEDQVARVQVSQSFVNTGSRQMEVVFVFPLPYDGAVDKLTFMVDGKEYEAELLDAKKAREIYEGFLRRNKDPALLEWMGTGMFKTSVFPVPAGAERTVTLRYSQLLPKQGKLTDFLFPLANARYTAEKVQKVVFDLTINCSENIKSVYSPTHAINVKRPSKTLAKVTFEEKNSVPTSDFRVFFDVNQKDLGASVISYKPEKGEDGFLLMLASPPVKAPDAERPKKTVILVLDRSGSMSGKKIEQAKGALKHVLDNLREGDMFNIVAYDSEIESFKPELEKYNDKTRKEALGFVEGIYAGGATNIDGALKVALGMLKDKTRPNYVLFLTDGLPTAGETKELQIVENARDRNEIGARVISFGVGYDVNARLLDRLSRELKGKSVFVRPNEDIEEHVATLYNSISSPVMTDVEVAFEFDDRAAEKGKNVNRVYPKEVHDLFEGEQLVIVGRYQDAGNAKVKITGKIGGERKKFDFPCELVEKSGDSSHAFVEKLWATRRIGEIIDQIDLNGKNDELMKELVSLSTKHGILTPYTSFLADDTGDVKELADARRGRGIAFDRAGEALDRLDADVSGIAGNAQRAAKNALREAAQAPAASGGGYGGGPTYRDIDSNEEKAAEGVRQLAEGEALYKRGKQWIAQNATDVDLEKDADKIETVERFTEEYFQLARDNTRTENAILAQQQPGEELIVRLRGQVYRIR